MMVGLDDDIYSLPKEGLEAAEAGRDPDAEPSAVPIIKRELRCDTATAVNQLVDYRDRIMLLLIRLRKGPTNAVCPATPSPTSTWRCAKSGSTPLTGHLSPPAIPLQWGSPKNRST